MTNTRVIQAGEQEVEISSPDKPLFPDAGISKYALAEYYVRIAPHALPYLAGRPISMKRYPDGIESEGFYQKERPEYFPDWVARTRIHIKEDGRYQSQVVVDSPATLAYLVDQGCVTPHAWLAKSASIQRPDRVIFDLDPSGRLDMEAMATLARALRDVLLDHGLCPFVMTTGSQGLHVVAPLSEQDDFDAVRAHAKDVAEHVAAMHTDIATTATHKEKRGKRIFIDYLRNAYGQTSVTPYVVRARPGAPVVTPLDWDEVAADLHPQKYHIGNIFKRLAQKEDPWHSYASSAKRIS